MMGQPIIQFEHISKAFAGQPVLRDLSLSIEAGEFVTVIGRSGCGKTTLLRLINRLITPDQGCVMVQGQDVAQTDPIALRRRIGYAIQSVGLFPHMTVEKKPIRISSYAAAPTQMWTILSRCWRDWLHFLRKRNKCKNAAPKNAAFFIHHSFWLCQAKCGTHYSCSVRKINYTVSVHVRKLLLRFV